jgi:hypothetical protein
MYSFFTKLISASPITRIIAIPIVQMKYIMFFSLIGILVAAPGLPGRVQQAIEDNKNQLNVFLLVTRYPAQAIRIATRQEVVD